jgi:LysR family transcriptional regulator, regulator of gene expression of beta-lactamase
MVGPHLPLNALRAFEASARHLSFTRAGLELRVTQAAVSHQVKALEDMLGATLFRRLPRGLALTDEGAALVPVLTDAFLRIRSTLERFDRRHVQEVVTIGCIGTFATGWLLARLPAFEARCPFVEIRLLTNNNRVDLAGEGLDFALRFGDGSWHGTEAVHLVQAPLSPVCAPQIATRLQRPADLARHVLLRSYRAEEWPLWFSLVDTVPPPLRGPVFDSSITLAQAAAQGCGVALLPACMFKADLEAGRLVRPFTAEIPAGSYWLTWLKSKPLTFGMQSFRAWITDALSAERHDTSKTS